MPSTSDPAAVVVRPMRPEDVEGADVAAWTSLREMARVYEHEDWPDRDAAALHRSRYRIEHLQRTDPAGAWVADRDGEVVGLALALRRGPLWFLSLLAVVPGLQSQGVGRRLLDAALTSSEGAGASWILATPDPKALRRYALAGFDVTPTYAAKGRLDRALLPGGLGVRDGDWEADGGLVDEISAEQRGAGYGPDLEAFRAVGASLRVVDGEGYAVLGTTRLVCLGARTPDVASRLLWDALGQLQGEEVAVDMLGGDQQWGIRTALAARLSLGPGGTTAWRGRLGPVSPYLPGGAYG